MLWKATPTVPLLVLSLYRIWLQELQALDLSQIDLGDTDLIFALHHPLMHPRTTELFVGAICIFRVGHVKLCPNNLRMRSITRM